LLILGFDWCFVRIENPQLGYNGLKIRRGNLKHPEGLEIISHEDLRKESETW
jgi:hypothetical protein